jgi:hypothetical protein
MSRDLQEAERAGGGVGAPAAALCEEGEGEDGEAAGEELPVRAHLHHPHHVFPLLHQRLKHTHIVTEGRGMTYLKFQVR